MENTVTAPLAFFKSKTRQQLLQMFFTNPDSKYYVRQLQAILGKSVGTLHRELKHLEESEVVRAEPEGRLKLYGVNKEHPLFDELTNIVKKTIGVEHALKETVAEIGGLKLAFTYGSFASGQETKGGRIDLCLMGDLDEAQVKPKLRSLEKRLERKINYTAMDEGRFRDELKKHPPELLSMFTDPKTFLVGDGNVLKALAG
jgi:DNA-binding transcriptional ArsR family regulator